MTFHLPANSSILAWRRTVATRFIQNCVETSTFAQANTTLKAVSMELTVKQILVTVSRVSQQASLRDTIARGQLKYEFSRARHLAFTRLIRDHQRVGHCLAGE
jgi:hypothetical protein